MHTTTCLWCKAIVKWVQTNSGTGAYHYSFVVQTNSGSRVDLYWLLLPPHGGGSDGRGRLALRSHLRL